MKTKLLFLHGSIKNTWMMYRVSGYDALPGYNCFDVFHNTHIKQDLDNYPAHLEIFSKL